MNIKDEMLADAIKVSLDLSCKIVKLKRVVAVMGCVIIALIIGYFL